MITADRNMIMGHPVGISIHYYNYRARFGNYKLGLRYSGIATSGCSLNIVFFFKCCDFSELCKFCCSGGVCHCVHSLKPRGNRERPESGIYFNIFEKSTIFNEHPVLFCGHASLWASFVYSPVSENYKQIRFLFHLYFFFINLAIQNLFLPSMSVSMYIIYKLFMHTGEAFFLLFIKAF